MRSMYFEGERAHLPVENPTSSITALPSAHLAEMSLPPELISRILRDLGDDTESLRSISLVSKAWVGCCQAHLFKSVHLRPTTLKGWSKNVCKAVGGPGSHTRTLMLEESHSLHWINPQYPRFPLSNLASFSDVRFLSLIQWDSTHFDGASLEPYFGHFGNSLRAMNLQSCTFDPATLVDFLCLLPNLDDLWLSHCFLHSATPTTTLSVPEVTPTFRGTLSLGDLGSVYFFEALAKLPLRFSTIKLKDYHCHGEGAYELLLNSCRDTLVALHYMHIHRDAPFPNVLLGSCLKLEELHVRLRVRGATGLTPYLTTLFSSITSPKFRKISLTFVDLAKGGGRPGWSLQGTISLSSLDMVLSTLAQRVQDVGGKLTLQLNFSGVGPSLDVDHDLQNFLGRGGLVDVNYD
ncbi:hypothetical protein BJ322DRAFT_366333 [Thelephora terrestris]|uniref:F-box domain-containing protein n=1 Tax=Thelephora terrestris TaxID=56493 RepID=A0A9P6L2Q0_9AGAM|nr:hypothetical protein BJ322DRAFT_366333 [Thelephora terrestris]